MVLPEQSIRPLAAGHRYEAKGVKTDGKAQPSQLIVVEHNGMGEQTGRRRLRPPALRRFENATIHTLFHCVHSVAGITG